MSYYVKLIIRYATYAIDLFGLISSILKAVVYALEQGKTMGKKDENTE